MQNAEELVGVTVPLASVVGSPDEAGEANRFSYADFAKSQPFANNILIATAKTAAADLLAQTVISGTPVDALDWDRVL